VGSINPTYAYLVALGEARSCLAALADPTVDVAMSIHDDDLLIELDGITGGIGPACSPTTGEKAALLQRLESAVDAMLDLGEVNGLSLGLLLAAATDAPVW